MVGVSSRFDPKSRPKTYPSTPRAHGTNEGYDVEESAREEVIRLLAQVPSGQVRTYPSGSILFIEGDDSYRVFVIRSRAVKLTKSASSGREVLIDVEGAGSLIGELGAIDGEPRSTNAVVIQNAEIQTISAQDFKELLRSSGELSYALLRLVTERLRGAGNRQLEMGASNALTRVASRLVELLDRESGKSSGPVTIMNSLNQQELAEWSGLSRDAVVKALRTMRQLGWINTSRNSITVAEVGELRSRAAQT
jgi:CRP/FNR family transcriptional regulator, cyclic AMP receptor protein